MNNWYKQKAFFLILIGFFFSRSVETIASKNPNTPRLDSDRSLENTALNSLSELFIRFKEQMLFNQNYAKRQMQLTSFSNNFVSPSNNIIGTLKMNNWLARQQDSCQKIDLAYQEVYSFQTDNYYISICQLEDSFYYHRQSKFDDDRPLLIPAQAISNGGIFQATSRGKTYSVGINGDRYYSLVMQNNNEIVFEPELPPSSDAVLARDLAEANSQLPATGVEADRATNASLELDSRENNLDSQALICTEASISDSPSHDWQQLLGESLDTASQYALNNGYRFIYDTRTPEQAIIATSVEIVNLNIATKSDTIEQVCIRPIAEN